MSPFETDESMISSHHEFGAGHVAVELPSNRSFATVFSVVFTLYAAYLGYQASNSWMLSALAASIFAVAGYLDAAWLTPLNRLWMKLGLLLGMLIAPIALGVLFFGVITPIGRLAHAFGKDFLRVNRDSTRPSYWIYRESPGPDAKSMSRQF